MYPVTGLGDLSWSVHEVNDSKCQEFRLCVPVFSDIAFYSMSLTCFDSSGNEVRKQSMHACNMEAGGGLGVQSFMHKKTQPLSSTN